MADFTHLGQKNASIVAHLLERNDHPNGISAAIAGRDQTSNEDGPSKSYGGFFNSCYTLELFCDALNLRSVQVDQNYIIDEPGIHPPGQDHNVSVVSCYNDGHQITVTLPENPEDGRVLLIRRNNNDGVTIQASGSKVIMAAGTYVSSRNIPNRGVTALLIFDGSYWTSNML